MRVLHFLALAGILLALHPAGSSAQAVRGQVVDSVTGAALAGAVVSLLDERDDEVGSTVADEQGWFLLYAPGVARYRLKAEHQGYHTAAFPEFTLEAQRALSYILLLPSTTGPREAVADPLEGRLATVCGTDDPQEPTIAGWIRDARTGAPVMEASVSVSWANLPDRLAQHATSLADFTGVVLADSAGFYAVCNGPLHTKIVLHGMTAEGISDFYDITFGDETVIVGEESFFSSTWVWRRDLEIVPLEDRHTTLRGTVTDVNTGDPVAGATVELRGTVYGTRTDTAGTFVLEQLPAGRVKLVVRQIGHQPLRQEITLPSEGTLRLPTGVLALGRAAEMLDPLIVETTAAHSPLTEFNQRRRESTGAFLTREEWDRMGNPGETVEILRRLRGVRITPGADLTHQHLVSMQRPTTRTITLRGTGVDGLVERADLPNLQEMNMVECPPLVFVDRHFLGTTNTVNINTAVPLGDLEAVEAHQSTASMPTEFSRRGSACGVIAFWTRYARQETVVVTQDKKIFNSTAFHFLIALGSVVAIFFGLGQGISF
ncbi:MAG: carboxypeptidase regulatory-like domain-containing protein [Gemmatimonadetes bacterium]|nr:carboxypeptidase regulatory-like domain-containing protein [Gemmatimonadota bacterium]